MQPSSIEELLAFARERSPFYKELYEGVPRGEADLTRYPVIDQKAFWAANTVVDNRVMTGPMADGIVFKSGGTTGSPKYSVFTNEEWEKFTAAFGEGMRRNGLAPGEKIANLFYAGELYASFLFIGKCIERAGVGINYPISGAAPLEEIVAVLSRFEIGTVAGVPTTVLRLIAHLERPSAQELSVDKILFGGESMYLDQRHAIERAFPGCRVSSIGYASVDGGELGYADPSCGPEEHRCFGGSTVLEIIDEDSGEAIADVDRPGKVVVTNLDRRLMPLIRYPAGDRAVWVEPAGAPDRKYRLLGRSEEGARIGPMTLYVHDVQKVLGAFADRVDVQAFQIVVEHSGGIDGATLQIAVPDPRAIPSGLAGEIVERVYAERHMFHDLLAQGLVHPLAIRWVTTEGLMVNSRTGKLRHVIDNRAGH